jgi:hypothetical protein
MGPSIIASKERLDFFRVELSVSICIEEGEKDIIVTSYKLRGGELSIAGCIALLERSVNNRPEQLLLIQSTIAVRIVPVHEIVDVVFVWDATTNSNAFPRDDAVICAISDIYGPHLVRMNAQRS